MTTISGHSPALAAALINSEIRSSYSDVSFHPHEREAFRKHAGFDIPDIVTNRWGVKHSQLNSISKDGVIPDDDPVYIFYKWFWKQGDGWNDFNAAIHDGLKSTGRDDLWTFFDPAVRVPSVSYVQTTRCYDSQSNFGAFWAHRWERALISLILAVTVPDVSVIR